MIWICLLLPACFSMKIRYKRNGNRPFTENIFMELLSFGSWILVNNLLAMFVVEYVLGLEGVVADAMNSFGFALKYTIISLVIACVLPYVLEICEKYISISLTIGEEEEK